MHSHTIRQKCKSGATVARINENRQRWWRRQKKIERKKETNEQETTSTEHSDDDKRKAKRATKRKEEEKNTTNELWVIWCVLHNTIAHSNCISFCSLFSRCVCEFYKSILSVEKNAQERKKKKNGKKIFITKTACTHWCNETLRSAYAICISRYFTESTVRQSAHWTIATNKNRNEAKKTRERDKDDRPKKKKTQRNASEPKDEKKKSHFDWIARAHFHLYFNISIFNLFSLLVFVFFRLFHVSVPYCAVIVEEQRRKSAINWFETDENEENKCTIEDDEFSLSLCLSIVVFLSVSSSEWNLRYAHATPQTKRRHWNGKFNKNFIFSFRFYWSHFFFFFCNIFISGLICWIAISFIFQSS